MKKNSNKILFFWGFLFAIFASSFFVPKNINLAKNQVLTQNFTLYSTKIAENLAYDNLDYPTNLKGLSFVSMQNQTFSTAELEEPIDSEFLVNPTLLNVEQSKSLANANKTDKSVSGKAAQSFLPLANPKDYETQAEAMALLEVNSGRLIYSKEGNKKLPMASLTKIITAIVAIENTPNLDVKYKIPACAQGIEGSSIYLKKGEHLTMRELLYGLMLRSGNDAAVAISCIVSGSVEEFVNKCNQFCASLGATNTNMVTPNGLHNDNHYTTAEDLAKITAYALKNQTFAEIVNTQKITIDNELGKQHQRVLQNKNKFLTMMKGANGVKTGYTTKAGRCFVGSATRAEDGMQIVCVLINCKPMFQDCQRLITQAQKDYKMRQIIPAEGYNKQINITGSQTKTTTAERQGELVYPLTDAEYAALKITNTLNKSYDAPLKNGQIVGEMQIFVDKSLIFCDNMIVTEQIEDNSFAENLDKIIENF